MARPSVHERASLLRDAVFAANDGIITTFAVVAGAAGASLSSTVVLILGFANLFADGISMASGNYLGIKSEIEYQKAKQNNYRHEHSPLKHGFVTYVFFILAGLLPLLPYVFNLDSKFLLSAFVVGIALFGVGCLRGLYTGKKTWLAGGIEMFLIGGTAALVAYSIGFLLDKYVI